LNAVLTLCPFFTRLAIFSLILAVNLNRAMFPFTCSIPFKVSAVTFFRRIVNYFLSASGYLASMHFHRSIREAPFLLLSSSVTRA
jgi:hypothetical protein